MNAVAAERAAVPLFDVRAHDAPLRAEILDAWSRILESAAFTSGAEVAAFEEEFAEACEVGHAVAVASGTDALELALRALGVGPGDRVIVPANTFIATAEAVSLVGARPCLVDCDPVTRTVSVEAVEAELHRRPAAAIIAVHLYGHPADMDALAAVAERHGTCVVEDAAQAHLARYRGVTAGGLGRMACFSFYPSKNLGAPGEGGAVTTNDAALAEAIVALRHHGQRRPNRHDVVGRNARLPELMAAALRIKLRHLERWTSERRWVAARYTEGLRATPHVRTPQTQPWAEPAWHLYAVEVPRRDTVRAKLRDRGIETGLHYPTPIHRQPAYADLGLGSGSFPEAERSAASVLSLPMFPGLTDAQVDRVVGELIAAVDGSAAEQRADAQS